MDVYRHLHLAVPLFFAFFGIVFVVFGFRRILGVRRGGGADAIFWGAVGISIGAGFFYGAYWFFRPGA